MLKVYLDRGEKTDHIARDGDAIMTVSATVFKPSGYKQFVRPWNRMLKAWGATSFHATDFYPGALEFKRDTQKKMGLFEKDSLRLPTLVAEHLHRVIVVAFRPNEFIQMASQKWRNYFGNNTHSAAVQMCMFYLGYWRAKNCPSVSFAYFHESGDPDEAKVSQAIARLRSYKEYESMLRICSFTMVDKGVARGLEASDFVSWHWNKHYVDKIKHGNAVPRKDFAAFAKLTDRKTTSAFVTGDKLTEFFATCDPFLM
jgi:hypothetical protein